MAIGLGGRGRDSGHLLAEHNGSTGAVIREYVWIDDLPLAVIDSSSGTAQTYYIHTGPVDEPLVMTDANKNEVWNAYMEPFGMATVFGASSAALDLRLPGQWLTAETGGLNQNGFRDYDPTLGRYVQPDPLGLAAGQNVYPYVDGDPMDWIDPWGLAPQPPPGIGHNGGPPLENLIPELENAIPKALSDLSGPIAGLIGWATPTPLNKGEDEQICRIHFGIPQTWPASSSNKGGGYKFSDPNNPNNNIRVMPGDPNSPNPAQQAPYVKYQNNGINYDQNGNPVPNNSAASHIPTNSYNPNVMPK